MRVVAYPADVGGCGHYRLIWPCEQLAREGYDVQIYSPANPDDPGHLHAKWLDDPSGRSHVVDVVAPDADVVVFQRPLKGSLVDCIPLLQAKGVRVVVEIDDDFSALHHANVSWKHCHPAHHPERNWNHLARACRLADLVTVTTDALARRYGAHGRVVVVPNYVPERYLSIDGGHGAPVVGWTGSVDTHPDDLQETHGGVQRAIEGTSAVVGIVGTGRGVAERLGTTGPMFTTGWLPLDAYPESVARLSVGVVPLAPSAFNEAKSWLKGLEMAALGVPFVASPTDQYRTLAALGAGRIARRGRDWEREVRRLIVDAKWRETVAAEGREVAAHLTIERNAWRLADAWSRLKVRSAA